MLSPVTQTAILAAVRSCEWRSMGGRPHYDYGIILHRIVAVLESGMAWRHLKMLPGPSFGTVHRHFLKWARAGVFQSAYRSLLKLYSRKSRRGEYHCIDTTFVKSFYGRDGVGRNPTDRGRKATKVSAIVNDEGVPLSIAFFAANVSDYSTVQDTLHRLISRPVMHVPLYADKGYDSARVRGALRDAGYLDRVGKRRTRIHRVVNARRGVVERFFSWLDKNRRLVVRYDSTITAYEAWTWLGCCKIVARRI